MLLQSRVRKVGVQVSAIMLKRALAPKILYKFRLNVLLELY
jgi:hypothetical protein